MRRFLAAAMLGMFSFASAQADPNTQAQLVALAAAKKIPLPLAEQLVVPAATLMRVDEGVFELEVGKSIDLTDRKILLSIQNYREKQYRVVLNGDRSVLDVGDVGTRFDLKDQRSTGRFVKDKEICMLDVVDIAAPKGAPAIFTFRLHCP